jgi:predicted short-subunit dehydrogenase-like oxidoreductase (DUF2520 family)
MRLAVVGAGRLGTAVAAALREHSDFVVVGPLGRGADAAASEVALLCVPDREIAAAAAAIDPRVIVGHCSGATGLEPLAPHDAFSLHPLMTVSEAGADFTGAAAAVDAISERALEVARTIADALAMEPVRVSPEDRVAYHAAASIASNFLVTLEAAAERLAGTAGVSRQMLVPLVRATVENWAALGPERALTGPVARGDELTVARQREAVAERTPELTALFDALTEATRSLAGFERAELDRV